MCQSHTLYHLCGHVKIKTVVQCAEMVEILVASATSSFDHRLCADASFDSLFFPKVCGGCRRCQQNHGADVTIVTTKDFNKVNRPPEVKRLVMLQSWKTLPPTLAPPAVRNHVQQARTIENELCDIADMGEERFGSTTDAILHPANVSRTFGRFLTVPQQARSPGGTRALNVSSTPTTPDIDSLHARMIQLDIRMARLISELRTLNAQSAAVLSA